MTATRPHSTTLRNVRDDSDLAAVVTWLGQESRAAALTSDIREAATVAGIRDALDHGLQLRLIENDEGDLLGLVTWRTRGNPRSYEMAILIADPALWASGTGADAAVQAVDHIFMTLDAQRLGVLTGTFNPYTSPALRKGGFTLEGVLRDYYYIDGEYHDAWVWSLLRDEHRALIHQLEGTPLGYRPLIRADDRERAARMAQQILADPAVPRSWTTSPGPTLSGDHR